jgi:hypothetical protein
MFRLCDRIGLGPSLLYRRPRAHDGREWSIRAGRNSEPRSIFGSFFLDDTFGSSLSLTMPSTLAPIRLDAGRNALSSRNGHPSYDGGIHCPRAFRRLVAKSPYLVGYCRWDSRFGRTMSPNNHTRDFMSHPLVETIGDHTASRRTRREGFRTPVDHHPALVLWNRAPAHR